MKKVDISPPSWALCPTRFNSLRNFASAMKSETFVLSIWAMVHRNRRVGATRSQRRLISQWRVAALLTSDAIVAPLASQPPTQARVTSFVGLAHAACADGREDFIRAEFVAETPRYKSVNKSIAVGQELGQVLSDGVSGSYS